MALHTCPLPEYPVLQVQVKVPGPVKLQVETPPVAQPLFPNVQLSMAIKRRRRKKERKRKLMIVHRTG